MTEFWNSRRVVVTGGAGFLGSYVAEELRVQGCRELFLPRSATYDLRQSEAVVRLYEDARPDILIHLAGTVGGIGGNQQHPGKFFYDNAIMGLQLIEQARAYGLEKFVCVGTVCSYPKFSPVPFSEEDFWNGYPEETNAPYGIAKKMLLVQLQAYRQEFGFNGIYVIPTNLYGPHDKFDDLEASHVIPAIMRKCTDAKQKGDPKITAWGTGSATREFLFAKDAAKGIVIATERYDGPDPVNLGTGEEISIRELTYLIRELVGYAGSIDWDTSKPDGQPRRKVDTARAEQEFGWKAETCLKDGLSQTVAWFNETYQSR